MTDELNAPPMSPADSFEDVAIKPAWPKVVGVISIVFASIGLICGGLGSVMIVLTPSIMKSAESQMQGGVPPQMLTVNAAQAGITVLGVLSSVLLLVAGIMLVSRNPKARMLHLLYAVLGLILTFIATYIGLEHQGAINEWVVQNPDADFSRQYSATGGMIGLVFGLALGLVWPIFILIWFLAVKRDPQAIAEGVEELVA